MVLQYIRLWLWLCDYIALVECINSSTQPKQIELLAALFCSLFATKRILTHAHTHMRRRWQCKQLAVKTSFGSHESFTITWIVANLKYRLQLRAVLGSNGSWHDHGRVYCIKNKQIVDDAERIDSNDLEHMSKPLAIESWELKDVTYCKARLLHSDRSAPNLVTRTTSEVPSNVWSRISKRKLWKQLSLVRGTNAGVQKLQ